MQLRRAQLVLMLAVLIPTILLTGIGVIMLVLHKSTTMLVAGILVLALCTSGITGYILGTVFVGKGASLVRVQNDFVSSVSHELRTPLTSIRLLIESLRTGRLENHEASQVLSLLGRETDRLEALVNRVLELSKLESTHTYAREMIRIGALVEESLAAFDAATLTLPTRIAVTIEPGLAVAGDRSTLVRALVNLLTMHAPTAAGSRSPSTITESASTAATTARSSSSSTAGTPRSAVEFPASGSASRSCGRSCTATRERSSSARAPATPPSGSS
jgi:signal transduction histidine kinase